MRVKAFSLMELIVVILLLGIMFSLALTSFKSKKDNIKIPTIKEIPLYFKKLKLKGNSTFLIYGDKCKKNALLSNETDDKNSITMPFDKNSIVYKMNNLGIIKKFDFDDLVLEKKEQHVCFKLDLKKGKFTDKFILKSYDEFLLFLPFFQQIKSFNSLEKAKDAYFQVNLYPKSIDDYYHK